MAVTNPVELTVAMAVFPDVQGVAPPVPLPYNCRVAPTHIVSLLIPVPPLVKLTIGVTEIVTAFVVSHP